MRLLLFCFVCLYFARCITETNSEPLESAKTHKEGKKVEKTVTTPIKLTDQSDLPPELRCSTTFSNSICIKDGSHIILPPARASGLIARYNFDYGYASDDSGYNSFLKGNCTFVPDYSGSGSACLLSKSSSLQGNIMPIEKSFTFFSWVFLPVHAKDTNTFCPIFSLRSPIDGSTIGAVINSFDNSLALVQQKENGQTELYRTSFSIRTRKWTRVAVRVSSDKFVTVYVNGVADAPYKLKHFVEATELQLASVMSGKDHTKKTCDMPIIVDEVKLFNNALAPEFIIADSGYFASFLPSKISVVCTKCTYTQAQEACLDSYHLCTEKELQGYLKAHFDNIGLNSERIHVENPAEAELAKAVLKTGVCCSD